MWYLYSNTYQNVGYIVTLVFKQKEDIYLLCKSLLDLPFQKQRFDQFRSKMGTISNLWLGYKTNTAIYSNHVISNCCFVDIRFLYKSGRFHFTFISTETRRSNLHPSGRHQVFSYKKIVLTKTTQTIYTAREQKHNDHIQHKIIQMHNTRT